MGRKLAFPGRAEGAINGQASHGWLRTQGAPGFHPCSAQGPAHERALMKGEPIGGRGLGQRPARSS
ncbi:Hypothetical protein MexAM1_META1p3896 [Methylorubrum extorquens AM1]|uniref:Uncharacterized protein n=1 Tax=Methylorubrum extorquens (strain ATCC 14718 / DSM 1338 / JCM 2805 / NCIMB 9133 / AM1) TaxID=272630 RepID=C5B0J4_METEA|nr:Hypothetical protein MexAM1_META1p3896 [Methylorubrum extorquens AM1]